jgi:hypothetical protein
MIEQVEGVETLQRQVPNSERVSVILALRWWWLL